MICLHHLLFLLLAPWLAAAGAHRWVAGRRFKKLGYTQLPCDGITQPAICCACLSVIRQIEKDLNRTEEDYEVQVGFRIDSKRRIPYSRSEQRISEVKLIFTSQNLNNLQ